MLRPVSNPKGLKALQEGRWVTYGPDVLNKKQEIEERWPELECVFDTVDEEWTILEHTREGTKLALGQTFKRLDDRVIRRLVRADDHANHGLDLEAEIDRHNSMMEAAEDARFAEIAGDAAERLHFAFKKDGLYDHDDIHGPKPKRGSIRNRAIRTSERKRAEAA